MILSIKNCMLFSIGLQSPGKETNLYSYSDNSYMYE